MSLVILFQLLCVQHVSDINISIFRSLQAPEDGYTVKPVLNGISRDQNIFPLKPGFRLIKVYYIQYKKLNQDMHVFETK